MKLMKLVPFHDFCFEAEKTIIVYIEDAQAFGKITFLPVSLLSAKDKV